MPVGIDTFIGIQKISAEVGDASPALTADFIIRPYPLFKVAVTNVRDGATSQTYALFAVEDDGENEILTMHLDEDLTQAAIGSSGFETVSTDTTAYYYFAVPTYVVGSGGVYDLVKNRSLLFAEKLRFIWTATADPGTGSPTMIVKVTGISELG